MTEKLNKNRFKNGRAVDEKSSFPFTCGSIVFGDEITDITVHW